VRSRRKKNPLLAIVGLGGNPGPRRNPDETFRRRSCTASKAGDNSADVAAINQAAARLGEFFPGIELYVGQEPHDPRSMPPGYELVSIKAPARAPVERKLGLFPGDANTPERAWHMALQYVFGAGWKEADAHGERGKGADYVAYFYPTCPGCGGQTHAQHEPCYSCKQAGHASPQAAANPRRRKRKNPTATDTFDGARLDEERVALDEAAQLPHYDAAVRRYEEFHGAAPTDARVIRVDDGKRGVTRKVVTALGEVPETHYRTPWRSQKATGDDFSDWERKFGKSKKKGLVHWVHHHLEGGMPLEVLDPETGLTIKLPTTESTQITDYWYD